MITLSNIHEFTDEQVFDEVERLLLLQGTKSVSPISNNRCLYNDGQGNKCAVGLLMDRYEPSFECNTLWEVISYAWPNARCKYSLLRLLQHIHDFYPEEEWQNTFSIVRNILFKNSTFWTDAALDERIREYKNDHTK